MKKASKQQQQKKRNFFSPFFDPSPPCNKQCLPSQMYVMYELKNCRIRIAMTINGGITAHRRFFFMVP